MSDHVMSDLCHHIMSDLVTDSLTNSSGNRSVVVNWWYGLNSISWVFLRFDCDKIDQGF